MGVRLLQQTSYQKQSQTIQDAQVGQRSWKPKVGPAGNPTLNTIRIMPPHERMVDASGEPKVFVKARVHFSLGPTKDVGSPCIRPYNEECPACVYRDGLYNESKRLNPSDPEQAKRAAEIKERAYEIRPQDRWGCNIVDMGNPSGGVVPYFFGNDVAKKLDRAFFSDPNPDGTSDWRDITHPDTGRDVLMRVAKKPGTQFNDYGEVRAKERTSPLHDKTWLDQVQDLSWHEWRPTAEQVQRAVEGQRIERSAVTAAAPAKAQVAALAYPPTSPEVKPAEKPVEKKTRKIKGRTPPPAPPGTQTTTNGTADSPWAVGAAYLAKEVPELPFLIEQRDITPEQVLALGDAGELPTCFKKDFDRTDQTCLQCEVVYPCTTAIAAKK